MLDPRNHKLAKILVNYSIKVKKGEKILITATSKAGFPLVQEIFKQLLEKGATPYVQLQDERLNYLYFQHSTPELIKKESEPALFFAKWADKFITIVADYNSKELANVDPVKQTLKSIATKRIRDTMFVKKWVLTYYPTSGMAYASSMALHELEDFYFESCVKNWDAEKKKMLNMKKILDKSKKVQIIGNKTDLTMDFSQRQFAICAGEYNMPDGEIFGAPLENSTTGRVYFDFPSIYQGKEVQGVDLYFEKGKVVKWDARSNKEFLTKMLLTDPGAKRLGEFGIGTNFSITQFMYNTLFDEKMGGTIHLALGTAFKDKVDGRGENDSAIHWDLVKDLRIKGSKLLVDQKVILKDGKILV